MELIWQGTIKTGLLSPRSLDLSGCRSSKRTVWVWGATIIYNTSGYAAEAMRSCRDLRLCKIKICNRVIWTLCRIELVSPWIIVFTSSWLPLGPDCTHIVQKTLDYFLSFPLEMMEWTTRKRTHFLLLSDPFTSKSSYFWKYGKL